MHKLKFLLKSFSSVLTISENIFRLLKRNFAAKFPVYPPFRKADCPNPPPHIKQESGARPMFPMFRSYWDTSWLQKAWHPKQIVPTLRPSCRAVTISSPWNGVSKGWMLGAVQRTEVLDPRGYYRSVGNIPLSLAVHRLVLPGLEQTASRLQEYTLLVLS
jgi:hypothetical protein